MESITMFNHNPDTRYITIINDCIYESQDLKNQGNLGIIYAIEKLEKAFENADFLSNVEDRNLHKLKIIELISELS